MALTWGATASQFIGLRLVPSNLNTGSVTGSFLDLAWDPTGVTITAQRVLSNDPGTLTVGDRYGAFYISGVDISITVIKQWNASGDGYTVQMGMCPLTPTQVSTLVLVSDKNYMPAGTTAANAPQAFTIMKQQPFQKRAMVSAIYGGKQVKTMRQSYKYAKFLDIGYPWLSQYQGVPPSSANSGVGVPPSVNPGHYFWMYNDAGQPGAGATVAENFDIEFKVKVHCTYYQPKFGNLGPLVADPVKPVETKEEKTEEKSDEVDLVEDLDDEPSLSSLSLSTPKQWTCLNPLHPKVGHERASSCV
jgi:hypothetical protein